MSSAHLLGALLLAAASLHCAGDIVEQEQDRVLTSDALRTALTSEDFRAKNRARKQIDTLAPPERLALLVEVASLPDPAARTLAVVELAKMGDAARPTLERLAADDPDPDIRELAAMYLEGDDGGDDEDE
ncbi:MAG: HEAT repeat domain-containing protein [Pseudomonadota bacterium]